MNGLIVGRMVHYVPPDGPDAVQAAVVCRVIDANKGIVHLHVFPSGTSYVATNVTYFETGGRNTWHWPPRE